ncbi:sigma-54-dependent Fis family transcriptional regulator [Paraburkholderia phenoliruptrix]|uniref:GAF modulated fis family sigma-54 specific transcriptional regulator n=2 Tax=Paraburkholderia phenoliruptrix TaxID=252970 RepID=K0DV75_9BURK|nr:sigma-54-dependent Fis family transcriptional regulator [Paraburkholderia phenoliruptrix]AFT87883.1 GAF modulated fis family sigma-54 specific transcriptional regulator [Paraburkholderia phenoliruptrix BR3459a]MDR6418118.1 transcriptional regulator of acetoin/glycerol metabolism [Paraburkholderia phenoliruptrix]CAB4046787.1 Acetoin catabolism regulatory protein [Paraburkholderia phenoliruptrix]
MSHRPATPPHIGRTHVIAQAHARSLELGLRASEVPDFHPLRRPALRELVDRNQSLYTHALPVMETLHAQIVDTQSMVLLTDSQGVILHSLGDSDFVEKANRVALCPGVSWAEADRGTNAIGTALVDGQPTVVHADEHFLHANRILTCSCAPIADPFGRTIGALDVSGDTRGFHKHTLALVRMSAQMIENHLFSNQFADAVRVHFHARAEFIGTLFEGLAAFAADGTFLSANRSALFQFGQPLAALQAQPFEALFGVAFAHVLQRITRAPGENVMLTLPSGVRVVARGEYSAQRYVGPAAEVVDVATARMPASNAVRQAPRTGGEEPLATLQTLDTGDAQVAAILRRVAKVRGRDIPILILGKTGTGKEWLARAIHHDSPRRAAPFVALNCASLPDTLIEAELFGYEDGAFTGAKKRGSVGKIVQADGGTLFLDEIGDMPLAQQVRLMRVLQERTVVPLGGTRAIPVDLRIVCATHRNLRAMIDEGTFREDLYYRINGLVVTLPALRERTDLAALVTRMLEIQREGEGLPRRVSPQVLERFMQSRWPGNLRQLANVLRTASIMAEGADQIELDDLPEDFLHDCADAAVNGSASVTLAGGEDQKGAALDPQARTPSRMEDWQATLIAQTLARLDGNVSAAARELGLARNTVYRYLRRGGTTH